MSTRSRSSFALGILLGTAALLPAQVTRSWNGTASNWQSAAAWSPSGTPGGSDTASFAPQTGSGPLPQQPSLSAGAVFRGWLLANGPTGDVFALSGNGQSLQLVSGTDQAQGAAIVVRGWHPQAANGAFSLFGDPPAPYTLRQLSLLQVGSAANPTPGRGLDLGHNAAFGLTNAIVDLQNEALAMHGGALVVADTRGLPGGGAAALTAARIELAGGTNLLAFRSPETADVADFQVTAGPLRLASGYGRVRSEVSVGPLRLRFGRLEQQEGAATVNFESNKLGNGAAETTFTEPPALTQGVIASTSGGDHLGWAIFNGEQFAGYAGSVVPIAPLGAAGVLENPGLPVTANLDLVDGTSIAAATTFQANTVRFGNSATHELGLDAQFLASAFLLPLGVTVNVDGGAITGRATRYFHIQDPGQPQQGQEANALRLSADLGRPPAGFGTARGLVKSGPGFLILTGLTEQVSFGSVDSPVTLAAGTLRARLDSNEAPPRSLRGRPDGQPLPPNLGPNNLLQFRGGVLEADGSGRPFGSRFARELGTGLNQVNWSRPVPNGDAGGSGGFSAIGGPLTVALGVAGVPAAPLTWDLTPGFVQDGHALVFGSVQTDGSEIIWTNPIALDAGLAGPVYRAREFEVLAALIPVGDGDLQVVQAVLCLEAPISGSASTDLLKTGFGRMELRVPNPLAGQTLVLGGTLRARPLNPTHAVLGSTSRIIVRGAQTRFSTRDGARLELVASDQLNDAAPLVLADGGTFLANGFNETLGALTVADGPSQKPAILDLGELAPDLPFHAVRFAPSAQLAWTGQLQIWNWSGELAGGGLDRVYFGDNAAGLAPGQLKSIAIYSDEGFTLLGRAAILPTGEIVPAPATEAPVLSIVAGPGPAQVTLRWPAPESLGFVLERNDTLTGPWVVETTPPVLNGAHYEVVTDLLPPKRFFRLRR